MEEGRSPGIALRIFVQQRKMKRKTLAAFAVLVMTALLMLTGCSEGGRPDRNTVYEQMKVAGITPGVLLSLDGKTVKRGALIPVSEIRLCLEQIGGIDLAG